MRLIKLTDSLTGERFYVDFYKVTDIEYKGSTIIWCGEQSVMVKETPEQIDELVKREKGELNMEIIIFTTNGYTYKFKGVKDLTPTTNGIEFEYFGASTKVWRKATFDYRGISGYAIKNQD
ncbi:hypothetical protein [Enterococcus cecorum]|uniref:Uncharacterized protein n=1 Tax=Enterococcus cecorum DSM 20682 = ATCC 43198 TaxID=1121864 RepID=S1R858_9ENTE|nr:hypothetical protein [Enterococcus cecorum]EOX18999.1 hypothetical protein I567_00753 [Enterococcus cecorum DSM 20682 = ATCC 43198]ESK61271.1 hypothetical protein OMO_01331 [Enterococcus cecorum DSM 20682 = ATCC 43198]OJG33631.1 hypothetical protein RT42_GL001901 [Enterococcus cecorum DSM 20682 = ATCC 43198]CAI3431415.1 hypothetical protein CIRMBP1318_01225 [Enterococcus cecorum DSM 20682 = ATCC 43198]SQE56687.1 Uncharacterised protein [Enterococcus cecorum]